VHKSSRPTPFRARTILCVDDESGALSIRKALLEQAGYEVLTAANAAQAFEIFQSNTIDLVVSDHLLPDAPGAAMAGQMKMAKPGIPILLFPEWSIPRRGQNTPINSSARLPAQKPCCKLLPNCFAIAGCGSTWELISRKSRATRSLMLPFGIMWSSKPGHPKYLSGARTQPKKRPSPTPGRRCVLSISRIWLREVDPARFWRLQ